MKVIEDTIDDIPIVVLDGDLDRSSKRVVFSTISGILDGPYPPTSLLLDLTDCTILDGGGLSVLFHALDSLPARGWLGIVGATNGANRVLLHSGFVDADRVRFFSSPSDAAASLAREKKYDRVPPLQTAISSWRC